ncbi:MAG: stalk domain-containing protein [Armatimonadota bacterium]
MRSPLFLLFILGSLLNLTVVGLARDIVPQAPETVVIRGTAMVPVAPMVILCEASVGNEGEMQVIARREKTFAYRTGATQATANGVGITLPLAPFTQHGDDYIPLQPLVTALGGTVVEKHGVFSVNLPGFATPLALQQEVYPEVKAYVDDDCELFAMLVGGGAIRRLTYESANGAHPQVSPDGRWLLYQHFQRLGKEETRLLLRETSSPNPRILEGIIWATFTPDSRLLFTTTVQEGKEKLISWVGVMNCDSTEKRLYRQGSSPVMSPDGQTIALTDAQQRTVLISTEGKSRALVLGKGVPAAFARDGALLLCSREYGTMNTITMPVVYVLRGEKAGTSYEAEPAERLNNEIPWEFSPDGRILVSREGEGLFLISPDRKTSTRLTNTPDDWGAMFTTDGTQIIFLRLFGWVGHLCRINADGTGFTKLTSGLVDIPNYTLTPDGSTILFSAIPRNGYGPTTIITHTPFPIAAFPPAVTSIRNTGMVQLRALAEQIGARVTWDALHKQLIVTRQGKEFTCKPGSAVAVSNGKAITLPAATVEVDDTLFVPVRPLLDALGGTLTFNPAQGGFLLTFPGWAKPMVLPSAKDSRISLGSALFGVNLDGTEQRKLTFDTDVKIPLVSPDGRWLIVERSNGIFIRQTDDAQGQPLLLSPAHYVPGEVVFTPDSTAVLLTRWTQETVKDSSSAYHIIYHPELISITLADGKRRSLGLYANPVVSPDGMLIAGMQKDKDQVSQVWLMQADGTMAHKLTTGVPLHFTPDGTQLVVQRTIPGSQLIIGTPHELAVISTDGTREQKLGTVEFAGFSKDGKSVYVWEYRMRKPDRERALAWSVEELRVFTTLLRYPLDGGAAEKVLSGEYAHAMLSDRFMIYTKHADSPEFFITELWVAGIDGSLPRMLADRMRQPQVTRDGKFVTFIRDGALCLVNIEGGDIVALTGGISVGNYQFTPDGEHLLFTAHPESIMRMY